MKKRRLVVKGEGALSTVVRGGSSNHQLRSELVLPQRLVRMQSEQSTIVARRPQRGLWGNLARGRLHVMTAAMGGQDRDHISTEWLEVCAAGSCMRYVE